MWTLHRQQQQRGAQMHARENRGREPGEAPADAVSGREAQEHDRAGDQALRPGDYPASTLAHADHDNTPTAPDPQVAWDDVVQPARPRAKDGGPEHDWDDQPLPEGK